MELSTERFASKLGRLEAELDAKQKFAASKDVAWHQSPAGIRYQNRIIRLIRTIRLLRTLIESIRNLFTPKQTSK